MKGFFFTASLGLSLWLIFEIQKYNFTLGYLVAAILVAVHFFGLVLSNTEGRDR
jgi:hypothetical protein